MTLQVTDKPAQQEPKEYLLHFIGSKTYGQRRFITEGKKKGVQRAIPFSNLSSVKFGQPILVAEYKPKERPCSLCMLDPSGVGCCHTGVNDAYKGATRAWSPCARFKSPGTIKTPVAVVFGYFTIDAISHKLPEDVKRKLAEKLTILDVVDFTQGGSGSGMAEERACGSYSMGSVTYVAEEIPEIAEKLEQAFAECGKDPVTMGQYFLRGPLHVFENPVVLEGCKFIRGYQPVKVEGLDLKYETPSKAIIALYDYTKRAYLTKQDAEQYDRTLVDESREAACQYDQDGESAVAQWRRQAEQMEDESSDAVAEAIKNDLENHGVEVDKSDGKESTE